MNIEKIDSTQEARSVQSISSPFSASFEGGPENAGRFWNCLLMHSPKMVVESIGVPSAIRYSEHNFKDDPRTGFAAEDRERVALFLRLLADNLAPANAKD